MARRFKTGGRKKGSKNKKKGLADLKSEVAVRSAQSDELPLQYMLRIMRDSAQSNQRRDEMARAAAPFVHAKLMAANVEHKNQIDPRIAEMSSDGIEALLVRKLIEWGYLSKDVISPEALAYVYSRAPQESGPLPRCNVGQKFSNRPGASAHT